MIRSHGVEIIDGAKLSCNFVFVHQRFRRTFAMLLEEAVSMRFHTFIKHEWKGFKTTVEPAIKRPPFGKWRWEMHLPVIGISVL